MEGHPGTLRACATEQAEACPTEAGRPSKWPNSPGTCGKIGNIASSAPEAVFATAFP